MDMAAQAIVQYRNTLIQGIGLSPAKLLHRHLQDFIPSHPDLYTSHPEWIAAAQKREKILSKCNADLIKRYNHTAHALSPLLKGNIISIPNCQYRIRVAGSGRITQWNSRFLRKLKVPVIMTPLPNTLPVYPEPMITDMGRPHQSAKELGNGGITLQSDLASQGFTQSPPSRTRIPRALSRLLPYNRPGNKELIPPQQPQCFCNGERREM